MPCGCLGKRKEKGRREAPHILRTNQRTQIQNHPTRKIAPKIAFAAAFCSKGCPPRCPPTTHEANQGNKPPWAGAGHTWAGLGGTHTHKGRAPLVPLARRPPTTDVCEVDASRLGERRRRRSRVKYCGGERVTSLCTRRRRAAPCPPSLLTREGRIRGRRTGPPLGGHVPCPCPLPNPRANWLACPRSTCLEHLDDMATFHLPPHPTHHRTCLAHPSLFSATHASPPFLTGPLPFLFPASARGLPTGIDHSCGGQAVEEAMEGAAAAAAEEASSFHGVPFRCASSSLSTASSL